MECGTRERGGSAIENEDSPSSLMVQMINNLLAMQEIQVQSLGWGRSPGEGHGHPLQYSCLENPMDRGAWRAAVHGVEKSRTQLND